MSSTVDDAGILEGLIGLELLLEMDGFDIEDSFSKRVDFASVGEFEKSLSRLRFLEVFGVLTNWQALTY